MDIVDFNARWLAAWSARSTAQVMQFYHAEVDYFDMFVPGGLKGATALEAHVQGVMSQIERWTYYPDGVWAVDGGYCGRWFMENGPTTPTWSRGVDLVLFKDGLIRHNEVFAFPLAEPPVVKPLG